MGSWDHHFQVETIGSQIEYLLAIYKTPTPLFYNINIRLIEINFRLSKNEGSLPMSLKIQRLLSP